MNMLEATLERANGGLVAHVGDQRSRSTTRSRRAARRSSATTGKPVILGIRPEDIEDAALAADAPDDRRLHGVVELREALGSEIVVHFDVDARPALTEDMRELARDVGHDGAVRATETPRSRRRPRRPLRPALAGQDGRRRSKSRSTRAALHFFDPETGSGSTTRTDERQSERKEHRA